MKDSAITVVRRSGVHVQRLDTVSRLSRLGQLAELRKLTVGKSRRSSNATDWYRLVSIMRVTGTYITRIRYSVQSDGSLEY